MWNEPFKTIIKNIILETNRKIQIKNDSNYSSGYSESVWFCSSQKIIYRIRKKIVLIRINQYNQMVICLDSHWSKWIVRTHKNRYDLRRNFKSKTFLHILWYANKETRQSKILYDSVCRWCYDCSDLLKLNQKSFKRNWRMS